MSMQSAVISRALRFGLRPLVHRLPGHTVGIRTARTAVEAASILVGHHPRAKVEGVNAPQADDEDARPVIGEMLTPEDGAADDAAILYLHGGGYIVCSPRTYRPISSRLTVDTGLPVFVPHYRLAPEHPFPAPLDDALDAYLWLIDEGYPADRIVIAGDSAGGHLAAALTGEICRTGLPSPAGLVLYSPWVDLTCELSTECAPHVQDAYISIHTARRIGQMVMGDFADPRLALLECSWADVPPVLIQVGGDEILRPEAERLAQTLQDSGTDCRLQIYEGQMHVFQLLNRVLPEAREAMEETASFVRTVIGDPADDPGAVA
ncbi:alpha/beta hydrolase [Thermomonospora umbrina]|uniref:Acetyl esterase/lipase n=1 Tax=Thermomonospora umbrina TaxID=111806 RepID=A0A3D9SZK0_9ACTN|nr:alpha/beta hydrolase [Thermomonospora umbrina]REE97994.1 acetyl esterase/lipase [Thermomonospora umbrina]